MIRISFLGVLACILCANPVYADEPPEPEYGWDLSMGLGATSWDDLSSLTDTSGGSFDDVGLTLDFGFHKHVRNWRDRNVLLGIDIGVWSTDSGIQGTFRKFTQRAAYLTPSIRVRASEKSRFYYEAGIGYYSADFVEFDCSGSVYDCRELAVPWESDTMGGYIGVSARLTKHFYLNTRIHMADFGRVSNINGINGDLGGPVIAATFGFVF